MKWSTHKALTWSQGQRACCGLFLTLFSSASSTTEHKSHNCQPNGFNIAMWVEEKPPEQKNCQKESRPSNWEAQPGKFSRRVTAFKRQRRKRGNEVMGSCCHGETPTFAGDRTVGCCTCTGCQSWFWVY